MEGQQLQWDNAQDALQAVHTLRHFDGAGRIFDGFVVIFVTDQNGPTLEINTGLKTTKKLNISHKKLQKEILTPSLASPFF